MEKWKEELKGADVDVDNAIARFCGKEERYVKYLKLFGSDNSYDKLIESLDRGDCNEAFECCHSLKGIAGNLGFRGIFPNMYDACEKLRAGEIDGVEEIVKGVENNYRTIIDIIDKYL